MHYRTCEIHCIYFHYTIINNFTILLFYLKLYELTDIGHVENFNAASSTVNKRTYILVALQ